MSKLKIDYKESLLNAQKYIAELGKENAELKEQNKELFHCLGNHDRDVLLINNKIVELKKQLTKATELLKEAQGYIENINDVLYDEIEQFIKEIEK